MKFFILGDSWGLGEWQFVKSTNMELVPNTGLDYYLQQMGHNVHNVSAASACNFGQLRNAYWKLQENSDYDYVIWFHTEPIRDIVEIIIDDSVDGPKQYPDFKKIKNYYKAMEYINICNYKFAEEKIYKEFGIPWIVIGGVGRLENSINNFSFAKHKIYSWVQELLGVDHELPRNYLVWHRWGEVFSTFQFDKQDLLEEFDAVDRYQKLLKLSPLFPDNCHVTTTEYAKLADRVIKML